MKKINIIFSLFIIMAYSCSDPYENTTYQVYDVNPVSSYLETRSDDFSEWIKVLKYADLFNAVNQATESFTVFVPDNQAVKEFYTKKGVASIEELGLDYAKGLARYHIIADSIGLDKFILGGILEARTLSDDNLIVTFDETSDEGGFNSIYINNEARVTELAVEVSNGYVYRLAGVLSPLVETVYDRINDSDEYTIFNEAIKRTKWDETLSIIYEEIRQPNGSTIEQKREFTLLAVSDASYKNDGILSINDLIAKIDAESDYENPENELNLYVAYHILEGNVSLFNFFDFKGSERKKLWSTSADVVLEVSLQAEGKYYLNYNSDEFKANFIESKSDVQARNGLVHQVNAYLPKWESIIPTTVYFDFCDYPEVASYIKNYGTAGQTYQKAHATTEYRTDVSGLSTYTYEVINKPATPTTSFNYVDYFTAKENSNWKNCYNQDQLILNLGYMGNVQMKTPVIIAGKYKVTLGFCYASSMNFMRTATSGSNGGAMRFSFDGEKIADFAPYPSISANTLNVYTYVVYNELEFEKTGAHDFKIVVTDPAAGTNSSFRILLDYLLFEPILED